MLLSETGGEVKQGTVLRSTSGRVERRTVPCFMEACSERQLRTDYCFFSSIVTSLLSSDT